MTDTYKYIPIAAILISFSLAKDGSLKDAPVSPDPFRRTATAKIGDTSSNRMNSIYTLSSPSASRFRLSNDANMSNLARSLDDGTAVFSPPVR